MLTIIQIGHDAASDVYVRNKLKAIERAGLKARLVDMPAEATVEDVLTTIDLYAGLNTTTAIMVQLPLPEHLEPHRAEILEAVPPHMDIDGLNPRSDFAPLTPCAVMRRLHEAQVELEGKRVTILGRSKLVGLPLANMLIEAGATVTVCNSHTPDKQRHKLLRSSDIIISAVGKAGIVQARDVNPRRGQHVFDVGINRDANGRVCGDVSPAAFAKLDRSSVSYCSPVPGGVGRWTVAELVLRLKYMEGIK